MKGVFCGTSSLIMATLRANTCKMKNPLQNKLHFLTLPKPKDSTDVYRAEAALASSSHIYV